jgi:hypothetical protein
MKTVLSLFAALTIFAQAGQAVAQSSVVEDVVAACEAEIVTYCSQVTPGNGRLLSCFRAHEDKLSVRCINGLYDGMQMLERIIETISYVANQCSEDIDAHCGATVPGEGRIAVCLLDKKPQLTTRCRGAIDEVGLEKN